VSGLAVLGAGAFGTALAIALGDKHRVTLWGHDPRHLRDIASARENTRHLPGCPLPDSVDIAAEIAAVEADTLLLAVPMQALRSLLRAQGAALDGKTLILCCKGLERETGLRPSAVVAEMLPTAETAILTGPSFAADIARGLPTGLCLAKAEPSEALQERLACRTLRIYATTDVTGAEIGGAVKNVIALAAGLTQGAGLGDSARAAIVTRGFAEISRFAISQGARLETLAGLSGLGDLILTCTSPTSRNFSAGLCIARGEPLAEGQTIEGLETARSLARLAQKLGIEMPLTRTVAAVTQGDMTVADAAEMLMSRPLKEE